MHIKQNLCAKMIKFDTASLSLLVYLHTSFILHKCLIFVQLCIIVEYLANTPTEYKLQVTIINVELTNS